MNTLSECNFLFLDELAVEHDPSGFAKDKLCELLSRRVGKWTVVTSNLGLEKLAGLDTRISSRMIRDGSVVVEVNTKEYALRNDKPPAPEPAPRPVPEPVQKMNPEQLQSFMDKCKRDAGL